MFEFLRGKKGQAAVTATNTEAANGQANNHSLYKSGFQPSQVNIDFGFNQQNLPFPGEEAGKMAVEADVLRDQNRLNEPVEYEPSATMDDALLHSLTTPDYYPAEGETNHTSQNFSQMAFEQASLGSDSDNAFASSWAPSLHETSADAFDESFKVTTEQSAPEHTPLTPAPHPMDWTQPNSMTTSSSLTWTSLDSPEAANTAAYQQDSFGDFLYPPNTYDIATQPETMRPLAQVSQHVQPVELEELAELRQTIQQSLTLDITESQNEAPTSKAIPTENLFHWPTDETTVTFSSLTQAPQVPVINQQVPTPQNQPLPPANAAEISQLPTLNETVWENCLVTQPQQPIQAPATTDQASLTTLWPEAPCPIHMSSQASVTAAAPATESITVQPVCNQPEEETPVTPVQKTPNFTAKDIMDTALLGSRTVHLVNQNHCCWLVTHVDDEWLIVKDLSEFGLDSTCKIHALLEGYAGGQELYTITCGPWRAILSADHDQVSLHTELPLGY